MSQYVPGCDGKAGMGVIATGTATNNTANSTDTTQPVVSSPSNNTDKVDVEAMLKDILRNCKANHLAAYQRPLFLCFKAHTEKEI